MVHAHNQMRLVEAREADVRHLIDTLNQRNGKLPPGAPVPDARTAGGSAKGASSPRAEDVRQLRKALAQDLAPTWSANPGNKQARQELLERGARYLDSLRAYAAQDSALALELAGAYQELGVLYEPLYRDRALNAFSTAAMVLNNASGGNPGDSPYREQWLFLAGRIRSMGGAMPAYVASESAPPPPSRTVARAAGIPSAPQTPSVVSAK